MPLLTATAAARVQIELVAYDRDGKALNWTGSTAKLSLQPATFNSIEKSGLRAHLEIDVPKTDVYLATGVYDWNSGRAGTLEIPLDSLKAESASWLGDRRGKSRCLDKS